MRHFGSRVIRAAEKTRVPAGGALAVDRDLFSECITEAVKGEKNIEVINRQVEKVPEDGIVIIATGPLTGGGLYEDIGRLRGERLSFYDAAAPIVTADSIDMTKVFPASRYGKGEDDYLNCPMDKGQYEAFYSRLIGAQRAPLRDFESDMQVYEGCMPVEVMASRGPETLRYGPLRPVGLRDPATGRRPWANLQLRKENTRGTLYNLVGFQTNLKFPEQRRVFGLIPGLENAVYARYGVMHRNSFINSPRVLGITLNLRNHPDVYFAGQITGMEGYTESAACGLLAGYFVLCRLMGIEPEIPAGTTMCGRLLRYITSQNADFQPMGANMGILPPLPRHIRDRKERYMALSRRGREDIEKIEIPPETGI